MSRQVAVIGSGQMGAGIAQVLACGGYSTRIYDANVQASEKALKDIEKRLLRLIEKGSLSAVQKDEALRNLSLASSLSELSQSDLIIEAIVENLETKLSLFKDLDGICQSSTVFASNTSSISITRLAAATKRPENVIGLHFMNPVPLMELVEVIRGLQTSEETYRFGLSLIESLGKTAVTAAKDYPGFIVNRILIPMLNEACFVLMEGIATAEQIDQAMKLGTNQPMGPLELADFVGLDTCLAICRIFHRELGDDKYRPCPLLVKYVEAGWFGKKSGRGFYSYS